MTDYMVTGLTKKRAELAGEIEATHERLRQMIADLEHIDATLRIVAPQIEVDDIKPKFRPPDDWSKRGQMSRMILDVLRIARQPMTTREIASEMIVRRGMPSDGAMLGLMTKRVSAALRELGKKGRAVSTEGPGFYLLWQVGQ